MQTYRRSLSPQETDHELLWLLVSLGTLFFLSIWLAARLPVPQCAFHSFTGLPCVTCGATRAAWQFFHGHFAAAFLFNPLAFFVYCGVVFFDLYAVAILVTRAPRLRLGKFTCTERLFLRSAIITALAGNWLYLLIFRPI